MKLSKIFLSKSTRPSAFIFNIKDWQQTDNTLRIDWLHKCLSDNTLTLNWYDTGRNFLFLALHWYYAAKCLLLDCVGISPHNLQHSSVLEIVSFGE